jgi:extracellular elastinolytic metalloproteinase
MIPHVPSLHTLAAVLLGAWAGTATGLVVTAPVQDAGVYWHVSATFGPRLPVPDGKNGTVVEANPINACEALNPDLNPNVAGQIVLAERGSCDFIQKVRNAQQAGAIAVVVYNAGRERCDQRDGRI